MKIQSKASLEFTNLNVELKPNFGTGVTTNLETYADEFKALPIAVTDLQDLNAVLTKGVTDAQTGNHIAKSELITTEKNWNAAFKTTANYVTSVAQGDEVIIQKSGFKPTKSESAPPVAPGALENFHAVAENAPGTVTVSSKAADAKGYLFIAAQNGATVTQDGNMIVITVGDIKVFVEADTNHKLMMHNLTPKTDFNISMLAFNSAGAGPLSASQNLMTQ